MRRSASAGGRGDKVTPGGKNGETLPVGLTGAAFPTLLCPLKGRDVLYRRSLDAGISLFNDPLKELAENSVKLRMQLGRSCGFLAQKAE